MACCILAEHILLSMQTGVHCSTVLFCTLKAYVVVWQQVSGSCRVLCPLTCPTQIDNQLVYAVGTACTVMQAALTRSLVYRRRCSGAAAVLA